MDLQTFFNALTLGLLIERANVRWTRRKYAMEDKLKETKEMLDLVLDGVSIGVDATKDGKIALDDAALLLRLIPSLGPAIQDAGKIPAELAALQEADAAALVSHVMGKLAIEDAHAREVIDASLKAVAAVAVLVKVVAKK